MHKRNMLIILIVLSLTLSSGCSIFVDEVRSILSSRETLGDRRNDEALLTPHNLVQRVIDSIRSLQDAEDLYYSIPAPQRDGLTLDEYTQYVRLLKRGIVGDISSFSMMNESDLAEAREEISQQLPQEQELIQSMSGVWLYYHELGRREEKFALYIAKPEDSAAHLSSEWVKKTLELANFSQLYFDAIENSDERALAVLLRSQQDELDLDLMKIKALRIIDFYQNNVSSRTSEFRVKEARMDRLTFEAFGITYPDQTQAVSRDVHLKASPDSSLYADDVVPDVLDRRDLHVFFEEQLLFQFAEVENEQLIPVRSSHFESIVGEPEQHDDDNCETIGNTQHLILQYESMRVEAEGTCFRHSRWDGVIRSISLQDSSSRLGSGLRPGQPLEEVLKRYPFAEDTEFEVSGRFDGRIVRLRIHMRDDEVEKLELSLAGR